MAEVKKSIVIAAPLAEVWAFSTDIHQWHTWSVGLSAPRSVEGDGGLGTVSDHTLTVYRIPMPLKIKVVTYDAETCLRTEFTMPLTKGSEQWTFVATEGGTEVTMVVEIELMGVAKLAEKMVVNTFGRIAEQALANLKARTEA
jgi:hypothetical protein